MCCYDLYHAGKRKETSRERLELQVAILQNGQRDGGIIKEIMETPDEGGSEIGAQEFGFGVGGNVEPPLSFKAEYISVYFTVSFITLNIW